MNKLKRGFDVGTKVKLKRIEPNEFGRRTLLGGLIKSDNTFSKNFDKIISIDEIGTIIEANYCPPLLEGIEGEMYYTIVFLEENNRRYGISIFHSDIELYDTDREIKDLEYRIMKRTNEISNLELDIECWNEELEELRNG